MIMLVQGDFPAIVALLQSKSGERAMAKDKDLERLKNSLNSENKRSRVEVDASKGRISADLNKSGSVGGFLQGGTRPPSRNEPRGEVHGGGGLSFKFGGGGKKKR
jgi:hypothetical protein